MSIFIDPADRLIASALVELAGRSRLSARRSRSCAHATWRRAGAFRGCYPEIAAFRSARHFRALAAGMPRAATARKKPARSGDGNCCCNNLDLLAKRDRAALMKLCGVDAEDLADMIDEIRQLDPKPAHGLHLRCRAADRARCDAARRSRAAAGMSSSTPTICRACWRTSVITRRCRPRRAARPTRIISANAGSRRTGWSKRCTSARRRF